MDEERRAAKGHMDSGHQLRIARHDAQELQTNSRHASSMSHDDLACIQKVPNISSAFDTSPLGSNLIQTGYTHTLDVGDRARCYDNPESIERDCKDTGRKAEAQTATCEMKRFLTAPISSRNMMLRRPHLLKQPQKNGLNLSVADARFEVEKKAGKHGKSSDLIQTQIQPSHSVSLVSGINSRRQTHPVPPCPQVSPLDVATAQSLNEFTEEHMQTPDQETNDLLNDINELITTEGTATGTRDVEEKTLTQLMMDEFIQEVLNDYLRISKLPPVPQKAWIPGESEPPTFQAILNYLLKGITANNATTTNDKQREGKNDIYKIYNVPESMDQSDVGRQISSEGRSNNQSSTTTISDSDGQPQQQFEVSAAVDLNPRTKGSQHFVHSSRSQSHNISQTSADKIADGKHLDPKCDRKYNKKQNPRRHIGNKF